MPGSSIKLANLTIDAVGSDTFGVTIGKVITLDSTNAVATAVGQLGVVRLTDIPADFQEAISIKVRLDNVAFVNPAGTKTNAATIRTTLTDGSTTFYTEDINALVNLVQNYEGTERTTSNGSAAWTSTQLNNLELGLEITAAVPSIGNGVFIDFAYVELKYRTPPPPTYDSSLSRPIMQQGTTILSNGTIIID